MRGKLVIFSALLLLVLTTLLVPTLLGAVGFLPPEEPRAIAKHYLRLTYNPFNVSLWTASPEAVSAIVWDYRGLDTLYETMVFYVAILAALMLYSEILGAKDVIGGVGLSVVVKRATVIAMMAIIAVGASTVLHGMVTPGGGFQGGAIMAVAPIIAIITFSRYFADRSGLRYSHYIIMRSLALAAIILLPILPVLMTLGNAFLFQNQAKPMSPFSYPSRVAGLPAGGLVLLLNLFEGVAVFSAFALAFIILLYSEALTKKALEGEDVGY